MNSSRQFIHITSMLILNHIRSSSTLFVGQRTKPSFFIGRHNWGHLVDMASCNDVEQPA